MATSTPPTLVFAIRGPIGRDDLPGLCDRVCGLLGRSGGAPEALCDVRGVEPDAVCVDALARLQLAARRYGCRVRLHGASPELRDLVAFMGLVDVLTDAPPDRPALHRAGSQAEGRITGGAKRRAR